MKNKLVIATFLSVFLLAAPNVQAANFKDNQTVETNKTWTVKFTGDVGLDEVTKQGITVTDSTGAAISVGIQLGQDSKTVTVTAPEGGYTPGESYILDIGTKAHSSKGNSLKNEYKLHFTIKNDSNNTTVVKFKDKNLEKVVRDTINKSSGEIYLSDVNKVDSLKASNKEISDLDGIQYLSNLNYLELNSNKISDISELKGLTKLQTLYLINNQISDISSLKDLTLLNTLQLMNNQIQDISPLKNLSNLNYLVLNNNKISDISTVSNLTKLHDLLMNSNNITDFSTISNLNNLCSLDIGQNNVKDISFLRNLVNLTSFWARYNQIKDISPLKNLVNLQSLGIGDNQIQDISSLSSLKNLTELQLINNGIKDVSPISNNINLKRLSFFSNQVRDISSLKNLKNLEYFTFDYDTILPSVEFMKNFPNLKETVYMGQFTQDKLEDKSYNNITSNLERYNDLLTNVDKILNEILTPNMTDYEKELAIHDYIVNHTSYVNGSIDLDGSGAFYQTLTEGKAVCEGYAEALNFMLNRAGIESCVIYGPIINPDGSKGINHAWNIVKIGGKYYHVDSTWDDSAKSYDYFNVSDEDMSKSRTWNRDLYPICTERLSK